MIRHAQRFWLALVAAALLATSPVVGACSLLGACLGPGDAAPPALAIPSCNAREEPPAGEAWTASGSECCGVVEGATSEPAVPRGVVAPMFGPDGATAPPLAAAALHTSVARQARSADAFRPSRATLHSLGVLRL
jgi:hypothetical protein